jgi:hypothetical protein
MDSARPHPPDTRPHRPLSAPGAERVHVDGGTRHTYRQVGWIGHRDGAMYAIGEDPSQFEPGGWSPLYAITDADDVLPPLCLCGGELNVQQVYTHDQPDDDMLADHLPQPATPTKQAERSPDADCVFVDVTAGPVDGKPQEIGVTVNITHTAGRPLNVAVNGVVQAALAERRRATFRPHGAVELEHERCDMANDRHVTPHVGCILR